MKVDFKAALHNNGYQSCAVVAIMSSFKLPGFYYVCTSVRPSIHLYGCLILLQYVEHRHELLTTYCTC